MVNFHPKTHNEEKTQHDNQHTNWLLAVGFATVALIAAEKAVELDGLSDLSNQPKNIKWIGSGILCALGLACIGFLASLFMRHRFIGNMLECTLVSSFDAMMKCCELVTHH